MFLIYALQPTDMSGHTNLAMHQDYPQILLFFCIPIYCIHGRISRLSSHMPSPTSTVWQQYSNGLLYEWLMKFHANQSFSHVHSYCFVTHQNHPNELW